MPDIAADSLSVAFGNWRRFYTIVDRNNQRMIRDSVTQKGFTLFYFTKRVGGHITDSNAVKFLRFGVA